MTEPEWAGVMRVRTHAMPAKSVPNCNPPPPVGDRWPYVLVGHSAGALYARVFTAQHPDEVVGMVLIDPGHPDMPVRIPSLQVQTREEARLAEWMRLLSYVGIPRLLGVGRANAQGLPPQQVAEVSAFVARPRHWSTIRALIDATSASYGQARSAGNLGSRPLLVLSANTAWFGSPALPDETRRGVNQLHAELAALSSNSRHCIMEGATHASLLHNRRHAETTSAAIRAVVRAVRTGQPLSPCHPRLLRSAR